MNFKSKIKGGIPASLWNKDSIEIEHNARLAKMDIEFQRKFRKIQKQIFLFVLLQMKGGSGFKMANILRHFYLEFTSRLIEFGPRSLPSSFNVMQAFFDFNNELKIFDIRKEREYLLRLHDYFEWYTAEKRIPEKPKILVDIFQENVIYSYDIIGDIGDYAISSENSKLIIEGISFIRHYEDLYIILLSGENPPYLPDDNLKNISSLKKEYVKGKHIIKPSKDLSFQDRYLDEQKEISKVILLTKIDLLTQSYDVRYINVDFGTGYLVFTDDNALIRQSFEGNKKEDEKLMIESSKNGLRRYKQLFSAVTSLIYLPIFFIVQNEKIIETKFMTELGVSRQKQDVRKAKKEFGEKAIVSKRKISCLAGEGADNQRKETKRVVKPPNLCFDSSGYWKPIGTNEIGKDKKGCPIMGKTWVERVETYYVEQPNSFIISKCPAFLRGKDPGSVYIIRSPSHGNDLYKVGVTRRNVETRAAEIGSSTGVPLPFGVLASWDVANCEAVEKEAHKILKPYRVNKRREFFKSSLSNIVLSIEQAISNIQNLQL